MTETCSSLPTEARVCCRQVAEPLELLLVLSAGFAHKLPVRLKHFRGQFKRDPGMYVPRPIEFIQAATESPSRRHAEEMLALTKMNWNSTQFDNTDPIAVTAARSVGRILKNVPADVTPQSRYSFYM